MSGGERIPRAVGPCPYWLAQGQWEEVKLEHRTQYNIQVLCEKIAAIAAPVWRFGDCHGGAVMFAFVMERTGGGSNLLENLCLSCGPCNSKKGTRTDVEFLGLEEVPF